MPPRTRSATRTPTTRPRTPSPEEARLLTVYLDAERYLIEQAAEQVGSVADTADAAGPVDAARIAGARRLRQAVERTVLGLGRDAARRTEAIIGAAAEDGVNAAVAQLAELTEQAGADDPERGELFNRGALDRLAAETVALTEGAHDTILRTTDDAYRVAVERTVSAVLVGAQTRREAAQRAMWQLTDQGITGFTDKSGRRWRLSSYVEMATRTAAARAFADAQLDRFYGDGHDFVIVSSAPAECHLCRPWEGAVLRIGDGPVGAVQVEHAITGEPITVEVAGTVAQARAAGLLHPNCRHTFGVYLPGVTRTPPADPHVPGRYEAAQRQRAIERHIRAWSEREAAALTPQVRAEAARRTRAWRQAMTSHLREHPYLARQREREVPDAGNAPTARTIAVPAAVQGAARSPRRMTDAEVERRMRTALARDRIEDFERYADEVDRRDARRAADRERRAEQRAAREAEQLAEWERLLDAGYADEQAVEVAYGVPVERQRRDAAKESLRGDGYRGTWAQMTRAAYRDALEREYRRAEDGTRGTLVSKRAGDRIRTEHLFTRNEAFARKWASEELLAWWDQNGRLTYDAFVEQLVDGRGDLSGRGGDFLQ